MDGLKRKLKYSLQARLLLWLSLSAVVTALIAGSASFVIAFIEANRIQDDQLKQTAQLISRYGFSLESASRSDINALRHYLSEEEALISVQRLDAAPVFHRGKPNKYIPDLPSDLADGFHTLRLKKTWRVFVAQMKNGDRFAASQRTAYRNDMAFASAQRTLLPLLLLIPVLVGIVLIVVRRMLRPVKALAKQVDDKTQNELSPLNLDEIPLEISGFVVSINRLLARIAAVLDAQQRFIGDAAHELRSPLTALSLQMQSIDRALLDAETQERLSTMTQGMARSIALLEQLLSLARSQNDKAKTLSTIEPRLILVRILEELLPQAGEKNLDVGLVGDESPTLLAAETDFYSVARNLIDNAIKYTPAGGQVDIRLRDTQNALYLEVSDTGAGLTPEEKNRVFDAFYRVPGHAASGSGLGLPIVKTILERINGTIELATREGGMGLAVTVGFKKH